MTLLIDSDDDLDKLIERVENGEDEVSAASHDKASFSFAKVWEMDKGSFEEIADDRGPDSTQDDFWAKVVERSEREQAEAAANEKSGRGVRRGATKSVGSFLLYLALSL